MNNLKSVFDDNFNVFYNIQFDFVINLKFKQEDSTLLLKL